MDSRRLPMAVAAAWGLGALGFAVAGIPGTTREMLPFLGVMTLVGVMGAFGAAFAFRVGRRYVAGMLLIVSAFTPTNGLLVFNSAALIVGFVVAVRATSRPVVVSS